MSPDDPRHGTYNGYSNLGCRCAKCRAANTAFNKRARKQRSERLAADDPRHGRYTTYTNHGCRCSVCRRAWADYFLALKARRTSPPLVTAGSPDRAS